MAEGRRQEGLQLTLIPMDQLAEVSPERLCVGLIRIALGTHLLACQDGS
jgi:hypothetical protein